MRPQTIAIDGPAGSGKSTLGRVLAARLGYAMLDAGLLYRLVSEAALSASVPLDDDSGIEELAKDTLRQVRLDQPGRAWDVLVGDTPLTDLALHTDAITEVVPTIARNPGLRGLVRSVQAEVLETGRAILAGRDIGTVVAPNADLKLFLDVSLEERASRRSWADATSNKSQAQVESELRTRDSLDQSRDVSPLKIPDDAVVVRTDKLSVDEAVDCIMMMCGLEDLESTA